MPNDDRKRIIRWKTPEGDAFVAATQRAMSITPKLNRLTFADQDEVRALFGELTGRAVDESFRLIPPFYTENGVNIRVGRRAFVNQCCTFYDYGGIDIGDDVMIGPNVSLITTSHPTAPSERRSHAVVAPIAIGRNVWIAAGVTVIGGVMIGENSVLAAGSVVTRDVPSNVLAAGSPARIVRSLAED